MKTLTVVLALLTAAAWVCVAIAPTAALLGAALTCTAATASVQMSSALTEEDE